MGLDIIILGLYDNKKKQALQISWTFSLSEYALWIYIGSSHCSVSGASLHRCVYWHECGPSHLLGVVTDSSHRFSSSFVIRRQWSDIRLNDNIHLQLRNHIF